MAEKRPDLGILTSHGSPPFIEDKFFRALNRYATEQGLSAIVFSPKKADTLAGYVLGYQYVDDKKRWVKKRCPIPRLIYDRIFYTSSAHYREYKPFVRRLQQNPYSRFLGVGLPGKWAVYQIIKESGTLQEYLPPTFKVTSPVKVLQYVDNHQEMVLKPAAGSLGLGVTYISKTGGERYLLQGRDRSNRPFEYQLDRQGLIHWLQITLTHSSTIAQPYLRLLTPDEHAPFDVRIFTQKNGSGDWEMVGGAVRIGKKKGLTSNLHGGGKGVPMKPFLLKAYGFKAEALERQIAYLAHHVPRLLERTYGPLVELGLDIGIDTDGKVWLIEVNSKPGRNVFRQTGEPEIQRKAITNLIHYTRYLLESEPRERRTSDENSRPRNIANG